MTGPASSPPVPEPEYDPDADSYRVEWDASEEVDLGILVVLSVAEVAGVDHSDLTPLNDVVDPDALNAIFAPRKDGIERAGGRVQFSLSGHAVTVDADGEILVDPSGGDGPR